MATPSLNFRNRAETGKTRCAQTVSRLFSARLQKFKAPSRAGEKQTVGLHALVALVVCCDLLLLAACAYYYCGCASTVWPLTFLPLMAPWIFVSGREEDGELSERSEFSPSPLGYENSRSLSPSWARLSLLTFFGKTKKVSRPRQGVKRGMDHEAQAPIKHTSKIQHRG